MELRDLNVVREKLFAHEVTMKEIVEHYLENIDSSVPTNAFVEVYREDVIHQANLLDHKILGGQEVGALAGAVISIKDVIANKGKSLTAGSKILEGFVSLFSATAVERLLAEDALIIGATNCDEFGMGSDSTKSTYGPVRNGIDPAYVAGGSSGGAAVSVQTGCCVAAIGSDTGGSVRQPASFCGVYGLKPTYGSVSRHGLVAYASSFDQIGVIANNTTDLLAIFEVIQGPDDFDSTVGKGNIPQGSESSATFTFAGFKNLYNHIADDHIANSYKQLTTSFGARFTSLDFDLLSYVVPAYYVLACAEASSNLGRYDGVRYGYRSPGASSIEEVYTKSRSEGFGTEVKRRIMLGTFVLSVGFYEAYFSKAQKVRRMVRQNIMNILKDHDFLLLPLTPTLPWKIGEKTDPVDMYNSDVFSVLANLTGLPSLAVPLGTSPEGLPYGCQLIGPPFSERDLCKAGSRLKNHLVDRE